MTVFVDEFKKEPKITRTRTTTEITLSVQYLSRIKKLGSLSRVNKKVLENKNKANEQKGLTLQGCKNKRM